MSIWDKAKAKVDQAVGHAEELWGQSHGDAAAALDGEARRLEGEAEEEQVERSEHEHPEHQDPQHQDPTHQDPEHQHPGDRKPDDDGLAGAGAR